LEYHYFPNSHWSRVVSLLIAEKGLVPKRHFIDIRRNATFDPEYLRMNPKGVVPTLVDDGKAICNSMKIARYLDDVVADPGLYQNHPRAELVAPWAKELETFPLMLFSYAVWTLGKKGERSASILDDKVARATSHAERYPELASNYLRKRDFFEAFRGQVYDDEYVAAQQETWNECLERMAFVVDREDWLAGDCYSFADAIAASILYRLVDLERLDAWHADPAHPLSRYFGRIQARPSFRQVWVEDELIPR
jgi:glutathione S-transferase